MDFNRTPDTKETVEFYSEFTINESLSSTVKLFTFVSAVILVIGVSLNCITLLAGDSIFPRYSSFAIYLKIILYMNIIAMTVLFAHHESYLLDFGERHDVNFRQRVCVSISWVYYLGDHSLTASVLLLSINRIRAQRQRDIYSTIEEAMRWPVVANSMLWLLVSVPVSRYTVTRFHFVEKYKRTECSFEIVKPFYEANFTDEILANLPLLEDSLLVISLFALAIEKFLKKLRERQKLEAVLKEDIDVSTYSTCSSFDDSGSDFSTSTHNPITIIEPKPAPYRNDRSASVMRFLRMHNIDAFSLLDNTHEEYGQSSLDRLSVALILVFVIFRLPRDIFNSMMVIDTWPWFGTLEIYTSLKNSHIGIMILEAIPQIYICSPLLLCFMIGSEFRRHACKIMKRFISGAMKKRSQSSLNLDLPPTRVMNTFLMRPPTVIRSSSIVRTSYSKVSARLFVDTKVVPTDINRKMSIFAASEENIDYLEDFPESSDVIGLEIKAEKYVRDFWTFMPFQSNRQKRNKSEVSIKHKKKSSTGSTDGRASKVLNEKEGFRKLSSSADPQQSNVHRLAPTGSASARSVHVLGPDTPPQSILSYNGSH